ncbi:aspartic peptidase domain-containing protein [Xylariaceae sp. FL0255]|nr:aspartic peptidase domain-containing protein [Xylariaceae sp. FL0255]
MAIVLLLMVAACLGMLQDAATSVSHVALPLTEWINGTDHQWLGNIAVGTPPQNFTVLFTTISSDLILPGKKCNNCGSCKTFDPTESSSFSPARDGHVRLPFPVVENSTSELANCHWVYDKVIIGGITQPDQSLILCDEYPPFLTELAVDGIIGLTPRNTSYGSKTPLFWNLWEHDYFDEPVFSIILPANNTADNQIILGGLNPDKYSGNIFMLNVDGDAYENQGTWAHRFEAIHVNGQRLPRSISGDNIGPQAPFPSADAVLDIGTPFIKVPDYETARLLYDSLSTEIHQLDSAGA